MGRFCSLGVSSFSVEASMGSDLMAKFFVRSFPGEKEKRFFELVAAASFFGDHFGNQLFGRRAQIRNAERHSPKDEKKPDNKNEIGHNSANAHSFSLTTGVGVCGWFQQHQEVTGSKQDHKQCTTPYLPGA